MSNILFAVSGPIAGIKAAQTIPQLVQRGHQVQVITTPSALKFVGSTTWERLTNKAVIFDVFSKDIRWIISHLARWADVLILCPARANAIANWANGMACDLPSTLFLAFERPKPIFVVPAMNAEFETKQEMASLLERMIQ